MGRIQRRNLLSYCVQSKAVCLGSPGFPSEWALPGRKVLGKDIRSPCPFRWRAAAHRRKYAWQQCLLAGKRDENRPFACIVRQQPYQETATRFLQQAEHTPPRRKLSSGVFRKNSKLKMSIQEIQREKRRFQEILLL